MEPAALATHAMVRDAEGNIRGRCGYRNERLQFMTNIPAAVTCRACRALEPPPITPAQLAARLKVYAEISTERTRQDLEHGGPGHDDAHTQDEWTWLISDHNQRALQGNGRFFRRQMVRVAALAIAAIEAHDRTAAAPSQTSAVPDATGHHETGGEA
jgi:hypothetical protein